MMKRNNEQKKWTGRLKKRLLIVLLFLAVLMGSYPLNASADDVGEPTVIVGNYKELEKAIANASEGDVIGINAAIEMEDDIDCSERVAIKRMSGDACLVFHDFPYISIRNIVFDGNGQTYVSSVPMVILNNMARTIIMDCFFQNCYTAVSGGALQLNNSCAELRNCDFQNNHALQGGHICMIGRSEMQMYDCALKGGYANTIGGAIAICDWFCTTTIYSSSFTNNTSGVCGGGIYNSGDFGIWDSTVYNNHSGCGADIANTENARLQISDLNSLKFYYNQVGIYPKDWVNDYDGNSGLTTYNIDPTQEISLMKLAYTTTPPESETEPKPEETETESTEKETEAEKQPESESESETKKESETETETESEKQSETDFESETEPKQTETEETETKQTETEQTETEQTETESEKQPEVETETKTKTETEAKPTESEKETEVKSEPQSEPKETIPSQTENRTETGTSTEQQSTESNVQGSGVTSPAVSKQPETEQEYTSSSVNKGDTNLTGKVRINGKTYLYINGVKFTGTKGKYYYRNGLKYTGWQKKGKKKFYFSKGTKIKNKFKTIKGKKYYFNKKGIMAKGLTKIKGKYYYFSKSGVMQKNRWVKIGKYRYYFNKKGVRTKKKK